MQPGPPAGDEAGEIVGIVGPAVKCRRERHVGVLPDLAWAAGVEIQNGRGAGSIPLGLEQLHVAAEVRRREVRQQAALVQRLHFLADLPLFAVYREPGRRWRGRA